MDFFFEKEGYWLFGASRRIRMFEKKGSWLVRASRQNVIEKPVADLKTSSVFKVEQDRDGADGKCSGGKGNWLL